MKTGLNDIDIKIETTTSRENLPIRFLKILEHFHYLLRSYGL